MSYIQDDSKHISLSLSQIERLCPVAKALSSPVRVKMIELLAVRPMNVNELADVVMQRMQSAVSRREAVFA